MREFERHTRSAELNSTHTRTAVATVHVERRVLRPYVLSHLLRRPVREAEPRRCVGGSE